MSYGGRTRRKGERRSQLKTFSSSLIKTEGRIDRLSEHSLASRAKAAQNITPVPPTRGMFVTVPVNDGGLGIKHIQKYLDLQQMWQGVRHQGSVQYHCIVMYDGKLTSLKMYFHSEEVFFIEENKRGGYLRKSITYGSTTVAKARAAKGQIKFYPEHIPVHAD